MKNTSTIIFALVMLLAMASACGGGGGTRSASPLQPSVTPAATGSVDGYLLESAEGERLVSAAGSPIEGAEVWCEDSSGNRVGQDTTGSDGHFGMYGLPAGQTLMLRYRYQLGELNGEVEGEMGLMLRTRERLRVDAELQLRDQDGDGVPDEALCNNEQMQVQLRTHASRTLGNGNGDGVCDGPEGDQNCNCNGECKGDCDRDCSAYNGEGADGDPPSEQQGDKNRGENGECDGKCPRDRDSDG